MGLMESWVKRQQVAKFWLFRTVARIVRSMALQFPPHLHRFLPGLPLEARGFYLSVDSSSS